VKINQNILEIILGASVDGNALRITQKLDRKVYLEVNSVLEACGGVWDRKAKAHLFDGDPIEAMSPALDSGEVITLREAQKRDGFFETPPELAAFLVRYADVEPDDMVLEPSAGTGRIVSAMIAVGANVTAVELDANRRSDLMDRLSSKHSVLGNDDFLALSCDTRWFDRVVMNPPFHKHLDHVLHAYKMLKPGGTLVSVLPSSVTFRKDHQNTSFRTWVDSIGGSIKPLPDDSFAESGTNVRTVVLKVQKPLHE
jgi:protein-L-isoaspartate O-methyltransferase